MSYERVEFSLNTPIADEMVRVPYGIELKRENGVITGLWVNIGTYIENEIEASARFKELNATGNFDGSLYTAVKEYGIQRAQNYLNRINFLLDSHKYEILNCSLVELLPTGQPQYTHEKTWNVMAAVAKNGVVNISTKYFEDSFLNKLYRDYDEGMKAQQEGDLASAYRYFYALLPLRKGSPYTITDDVSLNFNLKIIRDGISHDILTRTDMGRARALFGDEYVLQDGASGNCYAYFDSSNHRHIDLIRTNIHHVRKAAKQYIDGYRISGGVAP